MQINIDRAGSPVVQAAAYILDGTIIHGADSETRIDKFAVIVEQHHVDVRAERAHPRRQQFARKSFAAIAHMAACPVQLHRNLARNIG